MKSIVKASLVVAICAISSVGFSQTTPKKMDLKPVKKSELKVKPRAAKKQRKADARLAPSERSTSPAKKND